MYGISCIFQAQVTKFARKMPGKYPLMQAWRLLAGRIAQKNGSLTGAGMIRVRLHAYGLTFRPEA